MSMHYRKIKHIQNYVYMVPICAEASNLYGFHCLEQHTQNVYIMNFSLLTNQLSLFCWDTNSSHHTTLSLSLSDPLPPPGNTQPTLEILAF